jgi:hypothetical protein
MILPLFLQKILKPADAGGELIKTARQSKSNSNSRNPKKGCADTLAAILAQTGREFQPDRGFRLTSHVATAFL